MSLVLKAEKTNNLSKQSWAFEDNALTILDTNLYPAKNQYFSHRELEELEALFAEPEEIIEIDKNDFVRLEKEKTRQNWFAYELALELYTGLQKSFPSEQRKNHNPEISINRLAEFSIFYAREIAPTILDCLQKKQIPEYFSTKPIEKFFGGSNKKLINRILHIAQKQIAAQMDKCKNCAAQCFLHQEEYCPNFD